MPVAEITPNPAPKPRRRRRRLLYCSLTILLLLIAAELFARFYLGLGDPPLSLSDPQIEYLFKPSRTYHRFGKTISYNAYSMRSVDFPVKKTKADELRVLIIGDSVVNGGSQTDQSELATMLIQQSLGKALGRPVIVANISAGSWGPPNQLAYLKKFGLFDADVVILVESSHDYSDAPTFEPTVGVNPDYPDHTPLLALQEAFTRYLPKYLPSSTPKGDPRPATISQKDIDTSLAALTELIHLSRSSGAKVLLAQYPEQSELAGSFMAGHAAILSTAEKEKVRIIQLAPFFAAATRSGKSLYRDNIHPNAAGQRIMAEALIEEIRAVTDPTVK